jgi:hypothetical protein
VAIQTTITASGKKRRKGIFTKGAICPANGKALVAGLNESTLTVNDLVFNIQTRNMSRKTQRQIEARERQIYFDTSYDFQLHYGEAPFGKPRFMTAREAYDRNKILEEKFFLDKNPDARLWRWFRVGALIAPKGTTVDEYRRMKFIRSSAKTRSTNGGSHES